MIRKFLYAVCTALVSTGMLHAGFDSARDPFVLGFMGITHWRETDLQTLAKLGVNYIHNYSSWRWNDPEARLDLAAKYKMKVMFDLGAHSRINKKEDPDWEKNVPALVKRLDSHPALGIWYLWDEPATRRLPELRKLNTLVKAAGKSPTGLCMNEREEYWNTRGYSDIWMFDNYPVRGEVYPAAPLKWHSRAMRNAAASYNYKGTPFFAVVQACDFSCFKYNIKNEEQLKNLRFPNVKELRFMLFSDLCYGIRGFWFFSYHHMHLERAEGRAYFNDTLTPCLAEVRDFLKLVPDPWNVTLRHSSKLDIANKVSFACFTRNGQSTIVLVNDSPEKCDLKVDGTAFPAMPVSGKLVPWNFTSRPGKLENKVLTVLQAEPWEVFVWQVKSKD